MFANPNKVQYNEFNNICRTCLSPNNLKPLQHNQILQLLQLFTNINYVTNPELPQNICVNCVVKLNEFDNFRTQCKQTERELETTLLNHKNSTEFVQIKKEAFDDESTDEIPSELNNSTEPEPTEFIKIENIEIETQPELPNVYFEPNPNNLNITSNCFTPETKRKTFKCDTCNKIFNKSSHLYRHKIIHTGLRPYKCETCCKSFNQSGDLKKHERIHTGVKPYKCDLCDKAFNNSSDLIKHKRLHTGEKPYKCPMCGKEFRQSSDLIKHKRIHSDLYAFQCEVCNKKFKQKNHLLRHGRVHTDVKLFACDLCPKKFSQLSSLQNHKKIHFRVKKIKAAASRVYTCDICSRIFKQSIHLKDHKRIHTGERPYACEVCNKTFIQSSNLKAHRKIHLKTEEFV